MIPVLVAGLGVLVGGYLLTSHEHWCVCGKKWRHSESSFGEVKAHTCSRCGRKVWIKSWALSRGKTRGKMRR